MNKHTQIKNFFFILIFVLSLVGCDNAEDPVPTSADLKYVGAWSGSTNTMGFISIDIENIEQKAFVTAFKLEIILEGGSVYLEEFITQGITEVKDQSFELIPQGGGYLKGYFLSDTNGYGQYSVYNTLIGDTMKGNFLINNPLKEKTINSPSQFIGKVDNLNLYLGQDVNNVKASIRQTENLGYLYFNSGLKLYKEATGGYDTLFQVKLGKIATPASDSDFANLLKARSVPYATQFQQGVEVIYIDKNADYKRWTSSQGTGNQDGSSFMITESVKIDGTSDTFSLYKIMARFNCKLYDADGNTKTLADGLYIGFVKCEFAL